MVSIVWYHWVREPIATEASSVGNFSRLHTCGNELWVTRLDELMSVVTNGGEGAQRVILGGREKEVPM